MKGNQVFISLLFISKEKTNKTFYNRNKHITHHKLYEAIEHAKQIIAANGKFMTLKQY